VGLFVIAGFILLMGDDSPIFRRKRREDASEASAATEPAGD
jgi:hypothetical protein